jgi:hypothetical protein
MLLLFRKHKKLPPKLYKPREFDTTPEDDIHGDINESITESITEDEGDSNELLKETSSTSELDTGSDTDSDYVEEEELEVLDSIALCKLKGKIKKEINTTSLKQHFRSELGGEKTKSAIKTLITRASSAISWMGFWLRKEFADDILCLMHKKDNFKYMMNYFKFLSKTMGKKPSTILSYVDDIAAYIKWKVLFDSEAQEYHGKGLEATLCSVRKLFKRSNKKRGGAASKDIPTLIRQKRWPKGGLLDLINAVVLQLDWITGINESTEITPKLYRKFVRILCASAYVSPQGRPQAIGDMRNRQISELKSKGFFLSSKIKTASKFGYQPVTGSCMFYIGLDKYISFVRPKLKMKANDYLFIDQKGKRLHIGSKLTSFFESTLNLHITTTTIRSLLETEMSTLYDNGMITTEERNAIMKLNGHSSAVTEDFYIRRDRAADVTHAVNAFKCITSPKQGVKLKFSESCVEHDEIHDSMGFESWSYTSDFDARLGATLKSNQIEESIPIAQSPHRVKWTKDEIIFVGEWCAKTLLENPINHNNIVARCLEHIRNNQDALQIFHPNHILNSGRLKHALECYKNSKIPV